MDPRLLLICLVLLSAASIAASFPVDTSEQPAAHPPLTPPDGSIAITNPPAMIWRVDDNAVTYSIEYCQGPEFAADVIRVDGIDMPLHNYSKTLAEGTWYWRYFVVNAAGEVSDPSPVKSFIIADSSIPLPVPPTEQIIANAPAHPRIFVTPDTLDEFRARREGPAKDAWDDVRYVAESYIDTTPAQPELKPMPGDLPKTRKQVFYLKDGTPYVPAGHTSATLNAAAQKANVLSFAYLITGEERYGQAARKWVVFLAPFRMDYHLEDRGQHDTVVYNYEFGLEGLALAYDRVYDLLTEQERADVLAHIEYHCDNAYKWCRGALKQHLNYQNSHGQQCMHPFLTTTLAIMGDSERATEWADWLIRQYVNRLPWGSNDGGYTEGQTYSHKYRFIIEALAAMRTATGLDLFQTPRIRNSGDFWLYCMALNYWWNHWGDVYHLLYPMYGSGGEAQIGNLLAAMTDNRELKWYADTVVANPAHIPFRYISDKGVLPAPPIAIAQARVFTDVGQLAAYDRFYDHGSNRVFFRSSPFGGASHAHADQNGFVLHAGGEILACDAGYYTYAGDEYHKAFSTATIAHNSMLVNGQGQPDNISAKGNVSSFFNSAEYCIFTGEAGEAYPELLDRFDRVVLFIRPDVFIVYDELKATQPSRFDWLLNTFEPAEFDQEGQAMTVHQRDQRLTVRHLSPNDIVYSQSNERPKPMLTKAWCRYTEMHPQQFTIKATSDGARTDEQMLAVMSAYNIGDGDPVQGAIATASTAGRAVQFTRAGMHEEVAFQPSGDGRPGEIDAGIMQTDARAAAHTRDDAGALRRWVVQNATKLTVDETQALLSDERVDAAAYLNCPSAAAQIWVKHAADVRMKVALPEKPQAVFAAPPNRPAEAQAVDFSYNDGRIELVATGNGETVFWVDPVFDLNSEPGPLTLTVTDGKGTYQVELETALAENGEMVAFGQLTPREPGTYRFTARDAEVQWLIQDRWDPDLSDRGATVVQAPFRDGTEVYLRFAPNTTPVASAQLVESSSGQIVNLLRNGGFEAGIPQYPPRSWTTSHSRKMGTTWPYWSQDRPAEGESCLRFFRPEISMNLASQPMRLLRGGKYVLAFKARGNATEARVQVSGQRATGTQVPIQPSEDWQEYRAELDIYPGNTSVTIVFAEGGQPDQELFVDAMQFGYVAE